MRRAVLACLALLAAGAFAYTFWSRSLWSPDEGRYAEIGREMLVSGDWITPRLDYVRYFEKPALVYWATAASLGVFGTGEAVARFPVLLSALAVLALTAWLGAMVAGRRAGLMAAAMLASCPMFFTMAQFLVLDMPLAALVTAALCASWRGLSAHAKGDDGWKTWPVVASALLALGTLTKGPIAVILAGMVLVPALLSRHAPPLTQVPWLRMLLVYLAITVPWFLLIHRVHPEFTRFFFIHEHWDRYTKPDHARPGAWWYFLAILAGGFFPWSLLLPATLIARPRVAPGALAYLACWAALPVAFFSLSQSKLPSYILPVFPAVAVWLATALEPFLEEGGAPTRSLALGSECVSLLACAGAVKASTLDAGKYADLLSIQTPAVAILVLCAIFGVTAAVAFSRGRVRGGLELLFVLALAGLTSTAAVTHLYEPQKDSRVLADEIKKGRQPGEKVVIYGTLEANSALPYYLAEPVIIAGPHKGELEMAFDAPQGDEAERFITYDTAYHWMQPGAPRTWFATEISVYESDFSKTPGLRLHEVRRHGTRVLFTNK